VTLGVRRSGVSVAAGTLQAGGLIRVMRGHAMVLDHKGLTTAACDCYRIIRLFKKANSGFWVRTVPYTP
jgi:hypothetical protein